MNDDADTGITPEASSYVLSDDSTPGASHTGHLTHDMDALGTTGNVVAPAQGEPDPRITAALEEQIPLLGRAMDEFLDAMAPEGSLLEPLRERLHWGLVNVLHHHTTKLQSMADRAAQDLRAVNHLVPANEVSQLELERATIVAQDRHQRLAAFEELHSAAAFHYRHRNGDAWRPKLPNRSYVGTQTQYAGSYSNQRDTARAARALQRQIQRDREQAEEARSRRAAPRNPDAYHVVVTGDPDYPQLGQISTALERLHRKHPTLVVNTLHETEIGQFAAEWAQLHNVPHRYIGIRRPGDLVDFALSLPQASNPQVQATQLGEAHAFAPILRQQRAILSLNPSVVLAFGDERWGAEPFTQLAHDHQLPLWAFDRQGQSRAYAAGQAPAVENPLPTRTLVYAGIGARATPAETQELMTQVAAELGAQNFTLRSGGARGADQAFEAGANLANSPKQIFIPNDGFNGRTSGVDSASADIPRRAFDIAAEHHPSWDRLKPATQALHARNTLQILGPHCDQPVDFVLCWTADGRDSGGTGQALRVARAYNIPIANLGGPDAPRDVDAVLEKLGPLVPQWSAEDRERIEQFAQHIHREPLRDRPAEYAQEDRADFAHNERTLKHCANRFNRLLEVVGPQGTQLSDHRPSVAWGMCHVLHYQLNDLSRQARDTSLADSSTLAAQTGQLAVLREGLNAHYSALGFGAWNPRSRGLDNRPSQTYANLQASAFLAGLDQSAIDAHRPENARILVEGTEGLTLNDYDRLDRYLTRIRDWHREHEGRDISVVHKSPQSILRQWCENKGVHQHLYTPDFRRSAARAPAERDRAMVNDVRPDRYVELADDKQARYTRRHVEDYNRKAERTGERAIPVTRPRSADAKVVDINTAKAAREAAQSHAALRFHSRAEEGALLSPRSITPFSIEGVQWRSVHHYYAASLFGAVRSTAAEQVYQAIRQEPDVAQAQRLAAEQAPNLSTVADWDERRVGIMAEALAAKFAPGTRAAEYLLSTGERPLVHNGDPFWGVGKDDNGRNLLGAMLEQCRRSLRAGDAPDVETMLQPTHGIVIDHPAAARVADYQIAQERHAASYDRWTASYASQEPRVAAQLAAETTELSQQLGRAAQHFLANYERYEPFLDSAEVSKATLEADQQNLTVEQTHSHTRQQHQDLGAQMG